MPTSPAERTLARLIWPAFACSVAPLRVTSPPTSEICCPAGTESWLPLTAIGAGGERKMKAVGETVSVPAGGLVMSNWPLPPNFSACAVLALKEPVTSSCAFWPKVTPAGLMNQRLVVPPVAVRSVPSMLDAPPVTRAMILATIWARAAPAASRRTNPRANCLI